MLGRPHRSVLALEMRTSRLIILSVGVLAGAAAFALVASFVAASRPVGLGVQSYRNGTAIVALTNLSRLTLLYRGKVERKTAEGWPKCQGAIPLGIQSEGSLRPGEATTLTVPVMDYVQAYPWRISIFCIRPASKADLIRFRVSFWLARSGWTKFARHLWAGPKILQVSGPPMEQ